LRVIGVKPRLGVERRPGFEKQAAAGGGVVMAPAQRIGQSGAGQLGSEKTGQSAISAEQGGARVGGAMVSMEHGNFIVNDGTATARDVLELMEMLKSRAKAARGVELETEVEIVGE